MTQGSCPQCRATIEFQRSPRKGHKVTCLSCQTPLNVVLTAPIELDLDWALLEVEYLDDQQLREWRFDRGQTGAFQRSRKPW